MVRPVFISYARSNSAAHAQALAEKLGDLAFLDTNSIDDGDAFPADLLNGLLDAHLAVIFATRTYMERRFCRLEMRLALGAGEPETPPVVLALGDEPGAVLDAMPEAVAIQNWPPADATGRLEELIRQRLQRFKVPLKARFSDTEARRLAAAFLEESKVPEPLAPDRIVRSLHPGIAAYSIGSRFVGRARDLRKIHDELSRGSGERARLISRIGAGGGFGKTRLAAEYLHRYGPKYYAGGLFWLNAGSSSLDDEFWRILKALNKDLPNLAVMRQQQRNVRDELGEALRGIAQPALYIVDNIPEATPGSVPPPIGDYCPALGAVTVLATSRQDTREEGVSTITIDTLARDAAILLLTENVPGASGLAWADWGHIAEWVGTLPLALDLLNRCLALNAITPEGLLSKATVAALPDAVEALDRLGEALGGQVPRGAVLGITAALQISFAKLSPTSQEAVLVLAQMAPTPIPKELIDALPDKLKSSEVCAALRSRHFVTAGGDLSFGVMHRLMAAFLRAMPERIRPNLFRRVWRTLLGPKSAEPVLKDTQDFLRQAYSSVQKLMTQDRCKDPREWGAMNLIRPHAEALFGRLEANPEQGLLANLALRTAILAQAQGDDAGAQRVLERVLELAGPVVTPMNPQAPRLGRTKRRLYSRVALTAMSQLAQTFGNQGDYAKARYLQERVLSAALQLWGERHPETLISMQNLAWTLMMQGDYSEALLLQERVLEEMSRILGVDHPQALIAMTNLAATLSMQGDPWSALPLEERVLAKSKRVFGEEAPFTLTTMQNLGVTLSSLRQEERALPLLQKVVEGRTRLLGPEHPDTLTAMGHLGQVLRDLGETDQARQLLRKCLVGLRKVRGKQHPSTITCAEILESLENED